MSAKDPRLLLQSAPLLKQQLTTRRAMLDVLLALSPATLAALWFFGLSALLVLSACKTAAGDDRAALGLAGVAVQSGAQSALASLWYISDAATAELIENFYTALSVSSNTKAESLRTAQLALLENERFNHPSFWAPYLLVGNWL